LRESVLGHHSSAIRLRQAGVQEISYGPMYLSWSNGMSALDVRWVSASWALRLASFPQSVRKWRKLHFGLAGARFASLYYPGDFRFGRCDLSAQHSL